MNGLNSRRTWRWLLPPIGDVCIFYLILALVMLVRDPRSYKAMTAWSYLPLFAAWIAAAYTVGLYELRLMRDDLALVRNLLISSAACALLGVAYFYVMGELTGMTPKTNLVTIVAMTHCLMFGWRRTWLWILRFNVLDQRVAFLGDPAQLTAIEQSLPHHASDTGLSIGPWQWPGVDLVVADAPWVDKNWNSAGDVLTQAVARGVPVVTLEDFYESIFGKVSPSYAANPSWALEHIMPKQRGFYAAVKRVMDVVGAVVLMLLFAPALALTALAILVLDGRPILFTQKRVGLYGKTFTLVKFRTMSSGAESKGALLAADALASHVTWLGDYLRRFRLDELPQLWNVLKGEMTFIGPRPEWIKEVEMLEKSVPSNHLRHLVKPGVTGWAQVRFRQTNTVADAVERLHYDLFYVKYFSPALDFAIGLKTIKRILISDSTIHAAPTPSMPMPKDARWIMDLVDECEREASETVAA